MSKIQERRGTMRQELLTIINSQEVQDLKKVLEK